MIITFLIGNGFDVNLGLKTRYCDFYKYYVNTDSSNKSLAVQRFKKEIDIFIKNDTKKDDNLIDWRDLEVALGKWTANLKAEDVQPLYFDIIDNLKEYLEKESRFFDAEAFDGDLFAKYLLNPVDGNFNRIQKESLLRFWSRFLGSDDAINIINFNYTHTIEALSGSKGGRLLLGNNFAGRKTILNPIYHIHQSLSDEEILVGLNDISQLGNKEFRDNSHICNLLIKPKTNELLGTGIDRDCEQIIANTNLFVLFGTSVGITDKKWWNAICKKLQGDDARLLLFEHLREPQPHMRLLYNVMKGDSIRQLVANAGIKEESYLSTILPKCHVCYKSGMFNLPSTYNERIPDKKSYRKKNTDVELTVIDKEMRYIILSVNAPNEDIGLSAERLWIEEFFPKYRIGLQSLSHHSLTGQEVPFDTIRIESETTSKDIIFDISSFYGKTGNSSVARIPIQKRLASLRKFIQESY